MMPLLAIQLFIPPRRSRERAVVHLRLTRGYALAGLGKTKSISKGFTATTEPTGYTGRITTHLGIYLQERQNETATHRRFNGEGQTHLTIATEMTVANWLEGLVTMLFLRRVYAQEMKQIAALTEKQSNAAVVRA